MIAKEMRDTATDLSTRPTDAALNRTQIDTSSLDATDDRAENRKSVFRKSCREKRRGFAPRTRLSVTVAYLLLPPTIAKIETRLREREREREQSSYDEKAQTTAKRMIDNEDFFFSMKDYFSYLRDLGSVFLHRIQEVGATRTNVV